jgi:hypothetical protein
MRDKYLLYLVVSYALVIVSFVILGDVYVSLRSFILSIVFTMVLIVHFLICWRSNPNRLFYFLCFLWGIKWIIFVTSEGLTIFFRKTFFLLYTIDLFILLVIALLVSVSLLLKRPFWYRKSENKVYILFGIIGLMFSIWLTLAVSHFFINFEVWNFLRP